MGTPAGPAARWSRLRAASSASASRESFDNTGRKSTESEPDSNQEMLLRLATSMSPDVRASVRMRSRPLRSFSDRKSSMSLTSCRALSMSSILSAACLNRSADVSRKNLGMGWRLLAESALVSRAYRSCSRSSINHSGHWMSHLWSALSLRASQSGTSSGRPRRNGPNVPCAHTNSLVRKQRTTTVAADRKVSNTPR